MLDLLSEIRGRFQEAKQEWDSRLEDVFLRMRQNENENNVGNNIILHMRQHRPFRALLHLYAHEDVFLNKQLDNAFSMENQWAMSFYAPQLLCFLLHNVILVKIAKGLYFWVKKSLAICFLRNSNKLIFIIVIRW